MSTQNYKGPIHLTKEMFNTLMSTGSVVDEQGVTHTYEDGHEYIIDEIDYVDLTNPQTASGVKTFSDGVKLGSDSTTLTGVENSAPASGSTKAITSGAVYSALDNYVAKTTGSNKLYGRGGNNTESTWDISTSAYGITRYYANAENVGTTESSGYLVSHTPANDYHVSTKKYVDDTAATKSPKGIARLV